MYPTNDSETVPPLETEPSQAEVSNLQPCSSFTNSEVEPITSTPSRNLSEGVHIPPITASAPPGFEWKYLLVLIPKSEEHTEITEIRQKNI